MSPVRFSLGGVFSLLLMMSTLAHAQGPAQVACVGDSITFGDGIFWRARHAYPAVLEQLSNGRLKVRNFGVNGTTALPRTGRAWEHTQAAQDALASNPDWVIIMLGINDLAFPEQADRYPGALRALVQRFQNLPGKPTVFLCTLTPIAPADRQVAVNRTIQQVMNPAIRAVAQETGAGVIDISAAFPNRPELLPDGLHPSPEGAKIIAQTVWEALEAALPKPQIQAAPIPGPVAISIRNEAQAARQRAERWLADRTLPDDLPDPQAAWAERELRSPEDVADWLPLLDGPLTGDDDVYERCAALAVALARIGHERVFLAPDRPVIWREALLHQLVIHQRMDAQGGGYWNPTAADPNTPAATRATWCALQALTTAIGP